ncbi:chorismate mutase [Methanobacterium sp. BAmetb5]|uniref:chorismate mutase n=1 Tax=Methanobacterium sp. BAmetb5 TaxID=2025351 RepID=UPI000E8C3F96|nr:chorismate mutase [Methanobacterium sp. BAmetb5]AXV39370.1 MAG: chorismate mutase [Methanobacterium sp. BAmetb5]
MDRAEALQLLEESRKKIDILDEDIIKLIKERTSLASDILKAKLVLGMEIHDPEREEFIHHKIRDIAVEQGIDEDSLTQIIMILTDLSKKEQQKIQGGKAHGKH